MAQDRKHWERVYRDVPEEKLPWETKRPAHQLTEWVRSGLIRPCRVLDIGVGAGTHAVYFTRKGFEVHGLDVSETSVRKTREKLKKIGGKPLRIKTGDAIDLSPFKKRFDMVFDRGCFHHLSEYKRKLYARQLKKILKRGGIYYLEAFSDRNRFPKRFLFSREEIVARFSKDFEIAKIRESRHDGFGQSVYLYACLLIKK